MQSGQQTVSSRFSNSRKELSASLLAWVIALFLCVTAHGQSIISATEAKKHVGEKKTVCGKVAETLYAAASRDDPTFINLAKPYRDQVFKIVIWGTERAKFGKPEQDYRGKHICVSGQISEFNGVPEIVATDPSQIRIQSTF